MKSTYESKKQSKKWYRKTWSILLIAAVVVYFGSALILRFTTDPSAEENPQPLSAENKKSAQEHTPKPQPPSYEVKIIANSYADPTSRRLTFAVKNIGTTTSNPACSVSMNNEARTYNGSDYITWETPLAPGDTKYFEGLIVITNEGAAYANKSHVSCL